MAVSEIHPKDLPQVVWKELRVSVLVGLVLSVVNFIQLAIRYPGNELVALTVVLSLFATVVIAKTVGCVLPILAKMCHADPAIMAAPLIDQPTGVPGQGHRRGCFLHPAGWVYPGVGEAVLKSYLNA